MRSSELGVGLVVGAVALGGACAERPRSVYAAGSYGASGHIAVTPSDEGGGGAGAGGGPGGLGGTTGGAGGLGGTTGGAGGLGGSGGGSVCLSEPSDSPCRLCLKASCCPELEACAVDARCACWVGCYAGPGSEAACYASCGDWNEAWLDLYYVCVSGSCIGLGC
ncbi:MAG: hypothetical protein HY908_01920 [Myxococcales bacterium]|nr:hypothetical protein [Myxococcales bacterium]